MSDKLTISKIAQLRILLPLRLSHTIATRQIAVPCRNGNSCIYLRHNRCWFQHGSHELCHEAPARDTHRTSVKYYDYRIATVCAAPELKYHATSILHDNQHSFIAASYEAEQPSSSDDEDIPDLQDSSSDEGASAHVHPRDSSQRVRAKVYDWQVTSVSASLKQPHENENPGNPSNNAEYTTKFCHERNDCTSFYRWGHRERLPVCWTAAVQTNLPSNTIFNVIDLTDHRREEAAAMVAATTLRCLQRALAIFMLVLITFQVFHRNSLFSVVWHTQEEFTQTSIEQEDKMVQTDDHEVKLRAAVRRSFISTALKSIVDLCNHEGYAQLMLMTHLEWIHRRGIMTLELAHRTERLARGTHRLSRHFFHFLCLDSLAPMQTLLVEQEQLFRRQAQMRQDRARQNMSVGFSLKPTPPGLDKQWLVQAFKHNQRPASPNERTHSKKNLLMQTDSLEAEEILRTILINNGDMLFAYISNSPDRIRCCSQQMAAAVQLMHYHALKFALFEKTIELATASAAHRGAEPDKPNVQCSIS